MKNTDNLVEYENIFWKIVVAMLLCFILTLIVLLGVCAKSKQVEAIESEPLVDATSCETDTDELVTPIETTAQEPGTEEITERVDSTECELGDDNTEATKPYIISYDDLVMLAKLIYGEASIVESKTEQAAVVWCVLNRVDDPRFPNTITEVVTQPYQFAGYSEDYPVYTKYLLLAEDVLIRYYSGGDGRVIPKDYLYFMGFNGHNWFTKEYLDTNYYKFDIENSPYED